MVSNSSNYLQYNVNLKSVRLSYCIALFVDVRKNYNI